MSKQTRAPDDIHKVKKHQAYRDTRTVFQILVEDFKAWDMAIPMLIASPLLAFYAPAFGIILLPLMTGLVFFSAHSKINKRLPMKLPIFLKGQKDFNDFAPGNRKKFGKAGGTIMLGNLQRGNSEVWVKGKDLLTHMMVIGTTGGGKTELLVSLSGASSFCMGGGLIYVDAKAAPKLLYQFVTLSRMFGREDDFRVINYQTGNMVVQDKHWERLSNTTNPFAQGTANTAVQTLTGLLPSGGGDNQYFLDRAIAILRTLMPALVELRDQGIINIYPSLIGECISIEKFIALGKNEIEFNGIKYPHIKLSERATKVINTFLKQLPNFNPNLPASQQPEEASKQFGFAEGYFARTLANLAGTYGHIYETELAESDFVDIVMHNRILIVMVPAAESSSEERSALGKVVLSSIRVAMAQGLGNKGEGDRAEALDALPVDLRIPTIVIVDEYAEVAVDGFAVTATQGRGLGMGVVFAGQDLAGFQRANEKEADMIFGNTNIKVLLKLQDANVTWQRFKELAGSMKVASGGGWEQNYDGLNTYKTQLSASVQEADAININDLKDQIEGEAHLFESDKIHRIQMFHHGVDDDDLVQNFRINRMLKIKVPSPDTLEKLNRIAKRSEYFDDFDISDLSEPSLPALSKELADIIESSGPGSNWIDSALAISQSSSPLQASQSSTMDDIVSDINENQSAESVDSTEDDLGGMNLDDMGFSDTSAETSTEEDDEMPVTTGAVPSSTDSGDINSDDDITTPLVKSFTDVKNRWIFSVAAHQHADNTDDGTEAIFEQIVELNESLGASEGEAKAAMHKTLEDVSSSVSYPSEDIQSLPSDPDDIWDLIGK